MVYDRFTERTQIYLTEDDLALLEREANRSGASRSELIRRAIRARYRDVDLPSRREALRQSAGAWADREFTGESYVDAIREDLDDRLGPLGSP